jgi:hypothetical protein
MTWTRRDVLRGVAAGVGVSALGARLGLANDGAQRKVLEVFCTGALDPRHNLLGTDQVTRGAVNWASRLRAVVPPGADVRGDQVCEYGGLSFGRAAWPLLPLASRIRVVGLHHDIAAHSPAQEFTQSGTRPGRPRQAGLAARVHAHNGGTGIVLGESFPAMTGALATGDLGAQHAPYFLPIPDVNGRELGVGGLPAPPDSIAGFLRTRSASVDNIAGAYWDLANTRLTHPSAGRVRARGFDALAGARSSVVAAAANPELNRVFRLLSGAPATGGTAPTAAFHPSQTDGNPWVYRALEALRTSNLVTNITVGVGNFDTHYNGNNDAWAIQCRSLWAVAAAIADFEADHPDHGVLIVINTEFGRNHEAGGLGSGHYAAGYAAVVISPTPLAGSRYTHFEDRRAALPVGQLGPAALRNAIEQHMCIDPFAYEPSDYGHSSLTEAWSQILGDPAPTPPPSGVSPCTF